MSASTEQLIRELAEKLGTTVEHLWGVLVKQAAVEAVISAVWVMLPTALGLLWIGWVLRSWKHLKNDELEQTAVVGVTLCVVVVLGIIAACNLGTMITCMANPEYWALKEVLK